MSVQHQVYRPPFDSQLALELVERAAGVPQADEVRPRGQQDVLSRRQRRAMIGSRGFDAQQVGSHIENDPAIATCQLGDQPLDEAVSDAGAHFALGRSAQHHRRDASWTEWLQLVAQGDTPVVRVLAHRVGQRTDVAPRVKIEKRGQRRRAQIELNQHARIGGAKRCCQVDRQGSAARSTGAAGHGDDPAGARIGTVGGFEHDWFR